MVSFLIGVCWAASDAYNTQMLACTSDLTSAGRFSANAAVTCRVGQGQGRAFTALQVYCCYRWPCSSWCLYVIRSTHFLYSPPQGVPVAALSLFSFVQRGGVLLSGLLQWVPSGTSVAMCMRSMVQQELACDQVHCKVLVS
jgi:hypothetical protein